MLKEQQEDLMPLQVEIIASSYAGGVVVRSSQKTGRHLIPFGCLPLPLHGLTEVDFLLLLLLLL